MKNYFGKGVAFGAIALMAVSFTACSDDDDGASSKDIPELPECTAENEGDTAFYELYQEDYVCKNEAWEPVVTESSSSVETRSSASIDYGSLTDERDSQVYKTVKIGSQTWMAENLNFDNSNDSLQSFCYQDSKDSCDKYGRLYTWEAAMDSALCPDGYRLPSAEDFDELLSVVGDTSIAGYELKTAEGWDSYADVGGNGFNYYGFSALPAGYGIFKGDGTITYHSIGTAVEFWTSTVVDTESSMNVQTFQISFSKKVLVRTVEPIVALSVRCLKE